MEIPNLTEINIKDLKKEIFYLLLKLDNDYQEENIEYKILYHNMCATKQKGSDIPEAFELYDCSHERKYLVISNKFLLHLIKEQLKEEVKTPKVIEAIAVPIPQ